jgi:flagellin
MPQLINTNIASLNSQRNLNTSQSSLATSLQRLSSGLRINSAKDDAAGLAISERFTSQIRGLNQAARNANDGISLAQTAEGSLSQVSNNLQRIRELAVQSANATNSSSDRAALQSEAAQLIAEIDRVATTASFNGVKLIDGTFSAQQFQVGADSGQTISIASIASARTSALGQSYGASVTTSTLTASTGISGGGQFTIAVNGGTAVDVYSASGGAAIGGSAKQLAAAINASNITGITATANATTATGTYASTPISADGTATLTINGTAISLGLTTAGVGATNVATTVNAIQQNSAATGVTATLQAGNTIKLTAVDGRNIDVSFSAGTATGAALADVGLGGVAATTYGSYSLNYVGNGAVVIAGSAAAGVKGVADGSTSSAATGTAVSAVDISTITGANTAISSIDAALTTVNSSRASLGAYQNRFASVVSTLQETSENLTASRSRIQDADFAQETANLTRSQVLQQAGVAILAQANALPNQVLALLRG